MLCGEKCLGSGGVVENDFRPVMIGNALLKAGWWSVWVAVVSVLVVGEADAKTCRVDDLDLSLATSGWRTVQARRSIRAFGSDFDLVVTRTKTGG